MAEYVQRSIEDTLEELEQLERVGLFTGSEIKAIVKKRTAHEYCLNRIKKEKEDFLKYIQYEMNVLALIKKRRERQQYFFKKVEIEYTIVTRVEKLFQRVCTIFPEDLKLWLSYVQFARKWKRHVHLSQSFSKALRIHQNNAGLWILAAKYQFEDNNSSEHARRLLLKALRHHEHNNKVWLEYFRLELLIADKLHKRMILLKQGQLEMEEEDETLLKGNLAKVVYKNAIKVMPDDIAFRIQFTSICKDYEFTEDLTEEIYHDLLTDHPDNPLTWSALARRPLDLIDAGSSDKEIQQHEDESNQIFEDAVKKIPSGEMWKLYIDTCIERVQIPASTHITTKRRNHCLKVFEAASNICDLIEEQFLKWIQVLIDSEFFRSAKEISAKATKTHPKSVKLWISRLNLCMEHKTGKKGNHEEEVASIFYEAVKEAQSKDALDLWELGHEWFLVHDKDKLLDLFEAAIKQDECIAVPFKEKYLEYIASNDGMKKAKKLYKRLRAEPPLSCDFFRKYISLLKSETPSNIEKIQGVFEDAIALYGVTDPDLWLDFISMELNQKLPSPERIKSLHWRAKKILRGDLVEEFVNGYTLLQLQ